MTDSLLSSYEKFELNGQKWMSYGQKIMHKYGYAQLIKLITYQI